MSRNASGTYTLPAGNPVVTATVISSVWANTTLSDIATEMTDSLDRSGKGGMLAPLQLSDGLVGAPALTFATETTTGFYRIGAGQIGLSIAGNNKFIFGGADDSTGLSMIGKGPVLSLSRSSDSLANSFQIGSSGVGTSIMRITNTSGGASLIDLGSTINLSTNAGTSRFSIVVATGLTSIWEGTNNVAAAGLMQAATYETGSFTATLTGCTTSPTASVVWTRVGNTVTMNMAGNLTATSNTGACTFTGLPAGLQPARAQRMAVMLEDNTAFSIGSVTLSSGSGTVTLVRGDNAAFTAAGTKGFVSFTTTHSLA